MFPVTRPRRLRRTAVLREMVRETRLHPSQFIYPLFVRLGKGIRTAPRDALIADSTPAESRGRASFRVGSTNPRPQTVEAFSREVQDEPVALHAPIIYHILKSFSSSSKSTLP